MLNKKKLPLDFHASLTIENWRDGFSWVMPEQTLTQLFKDMDLRIRTLAESYADNQSKKYLFLLAIRVIRLQILDLLYAAVTVDYADKQNIDLISSINEVNFINTGEQQYLSSQHKSELVEKTQKWMFLRRLARTLSWTPWWKLPFVALRPEIIAVTHNEILRRKAEISPESVYFYQGGLLLERARKAYTPQALPAYIDELYNDIVDSVIAFPDIDGLYLQRLKILLERTIKAHLTQSYRDLEALRQYRSLPRQVWIGAGSAYLNRVIASAVLANGGQVTSFAHATGAVLTPNFDFFLISELAVTNRFITISSKAAEIIDTNLPQALRAAFHRFTISSVDGNPKFKDYARRIKQDSSINKKPTVIYTSTVIYPLRNWVCASNTVYLDWQLRLVKMLQEMDIELICQPHPEGIFRDENLIHPLRKELNIPYRRFEDIVEQADVFLVDFIHSTTFGEMLCTNKPIVRIALNDDSAIGGVRNDIRSLLHERCKTVPVFFGEDNLPCVDKKLLENALLENWQEPVDSTVFQKLFMD